ncbi:hypothetical protein CMK11_14235 [Candidatus Poribacteria bacterium]|nr:hypothetical protein [Candidatus Poribacteria bacterium]
MALRVDGPYRGEKGCAVEHDEKLDEVIRALSSIRTAVWGIAAVLAVVAALIVGVVIILT